MSKFKDFDLDLNIVKKKRQINVEMFFSKKSKLFRRLSSTSDSTLCPTISPTDMGMCDNLKAKNNENGDIEPLRC